MSVVETPGFLRDAAMVFTDRERGELVAFLAANPEAGDIIPETGGTRKLRWRMQGRGKSGGARAIYYYHNKSLPIFLLNFFAKNEKGFREERENKSLQGGAK